MEVVAGGDAGFDRRVAAAICGGAGDVGAVFEHFDEGDEEVVDALAELLHVGVLVGGALVAVDGDALVDDVAVEVLLLAERLHDELLEVAGEEQEAVFVGEDDHVFLPLAVAGVVPHQRQQRGGVLRVSYMRVTSSHRVRRRAWRRCRCPGAPRGAGRRRRARWCGRRPSPTWGSGRASFPRRRLCRARSRRR